MENAKYIDELANKIKKYQKSYYENEAEISDEEFDALWDELKSRGAKVVDGKIIIELD